jgi:hypothetical protein
METSIALGVMVSLIGCFVGLTGWLAKREKRIWTDGKWQGNVDAKLDNILGIKQDVDNLQKTVNEHGNRLKAVEKDVSNVHYRINKLKERRIE